MSPTRAIIPHLLALAATLVSCGDSGPSPEKELSGGKAADTHAPAPRRTVELPTSLVPDDALALIVVPSVRSLQAAIGDVVDLVGEAPPFPTDPLALLSAAGVPGDLTHVDLERPLIVAVRFDQVPTPAFILPVRDGAAYKASAGRVRVHLARGYALVGAEPGGSSDLAADMPAGLVSVRLDLERIGPMLLPLIQSQLANADPGEAPGVDVSAMLAVMGDFVADFFASARTLDVTLGWSDGVLAFDGRLALVPEGPFAAWIGDEPTGARELAGSLDSDAGMAFIGGFEPKVMKEHLMPWVERLFDVYPESVREAFQSSVRAMDEHYETMGRAFAGNQDFGENGLEYTYVMVPEDPEALVDSMVELFASPAFESFGYKAGEVEEREEAGARIVSFPLQFDLAEMFATVEGGADAAEIEEMTAAMGGIFGDDTKLTMAVRGRYVVIRFGRDTEVESALARAEAGGEVPVPFRPLLALHGDANPVLLAHMDLGRLLGGVFRAMSEQGTDAPVIPENAAIGLTFYAAGQGTDAHFGFRFELAKMIELVRELGK